MLALLAGPGLSAHHVFTQRLHLVRVSGARFYKHEGESMQPRDVFTFPTLGRVSTLYFMNLLSECSSPVCLADFASQHATHCEEVSVGGGAGAGGSGRRPRSSCPQRCQQPQVVTLMGFNI